MKMNDLKVGQVVRSTAGRDKGQFLIVCEILDADYVAICDGKQRKISQPKKKKVKHLAKTNHIVAILHEKITNGDKINNAEIRKHLEKYGVNDKGSEEV
ncbi:MAG: KOW domain-containing RNA-binding protein [Eubacterium sp.]